MNLSSYKLVACDLDGTLLREDHTVSPENLLAIAEMDRLGVQFVPTTGRALAEMPCELLSSPHIRYYITSDGAAIFDKNTGEVVHSEYISEDMLRLQRLLRSITCKSHGTLQQLLRLDCKCVNIHICIVF